MRRDPDLCGLRCDHQPSVIRVCIAGSTGWTGSAVAAAVAAAADLELVSSVSRSGAGRDKVHSSVPEALDAAAADVLVDYTHPTVVRANVHAALERGVNVVVGTSGLTSDEYAEIDELAKEHAVGVIAAGNFSLLAALLLRGALEVARHVDSWEIIDYAKADKPDVPSGTARELAERLEAVRRPQTARPIESLQGPTEARGTNVAGTQVHSVRLPSFVVSTEAVFAAAGERLVLRHDAGEHSAPYVAGTLLAIRSVVGRTGLTRGLDALLA
jgi:4-hydroxy-tetrahydrodipicolinate reductase